MAEKNILMCCSCNKPTSGGHSCKICEKPCHAIELCSVSCGEEGYGANVICSDCFINVDDIEDSEEGNNEVDVKEQVKKAKKRAYTITEKIDILDFARNTSIHEASRHFKIDRVTIRNWKKQESSLKSMKNPSTRKRSIGGGRKLADSDFDNALKSWINELRSKKLRVTRNMIVLEAQKISISYPGLENFKASNGWLDYFLKRHNFSMRRPTSVAQKTPEEFAEIIVNFILYVQKLWKKNNFTHVYAADETSISLDPVGGLCVAEKGSKTVTVKSTGHEKTHVTVMLTARSDGFKLPPFVLLPRKRPIPEIEKLFKNKLKLVWCGKNWMDNELISKYLEEVFGNFLFGSRLLIWDSFRAHISGETKQTLKRLSIHTAVVPGGTTKYIQVPDISWNHPFKNSIREQHTNWMIHGQKPTTSSGNLKAPAIETYLEWISSAWDSLSKDLIIKSFVSCGMTTDENGKLDEHIHVFKPEGAISNGITLLRQRRNENAIENLNLIEEIDVEEDKIYESDFSIELNIDLNI
uniref:HTH CENPB-type domain-containing protein n=2 Tax=Meloidogyne enterolobii TaxID=390850 RepID=A0A6V7XBJ9_MELEN|nr:unnamed protein product [Meloidogyne enterolobii]